MQRVDGKSVIHPTWHEWPGTRIEYVSSDTDQLRDAVVLNAYGQPERTRLISESGIYAVLIHYYHRRIAAFASGSPLTWCRRCATANH